MAYYKVFQSIAAILLILGGACLADHTRDIRVNVSRRMCEPCSGHAVRIECVSWDKSTSPVEVAREVVDEMVSSLKTVRHLIQKELRALHLSADIPGNLSNLVTIDNLTNIEHNSSCSKHLKTRIKPRYILQVIYTRTLLFSAYMDALTRIYKRSHRNSSDILGNITLELKRIVCTTVDLFSNLGLKKIKRGLTKCLCNYKTHINGLWMSDYMTSILGHGHRLVDDSIEDLNALVSETEQCKLKCRRGKNLRLKCRGKQPRKLRRGRKGRKDKKGRRRNRKNKNRRNNKNRGGKGGQDKSIKNVNVKGKRKGNRRKGRNNSQNRFA